MTSWDACEFRGSSGLSSSTQCTPTSGALCLTQVNHVTQSIDPLNSYGPAPPPPPPTAPPPVLITCSHVIWLRLVVLPLPSGFFLLSEGHCRFFLTSDVVWVWFGCWSSRCCVLGRWVSRALTRWGLVAEGVRLFEEISAVLEGPWLIPVSMSCYKEKVWPQDFSVSPSNFSVSSHLTRDFTSAKLRAIWTFFFVLHPQVFV